MKQKLTLFALVGLVGLVVLFWGAPAFSADMSELERKIDILSDELDDLKEGDMLKGQRGRSRKFQQPNLVTMFGYGELHLNAPLSGPNAQTQLDNHRYVIGVHAILAKWIHFTAEIDFEHAAQLLEFEVSYLDFLINPGFNVRAGVMLAPIGFLNEYHEPPLFWTAERPLLQQRLIPTTWSVAGAGVLGSPVDGFNYRVYAVGSLQSIEDNNGSGGSGNGGGGDASSFSSDGIRGGRHQINKAIAENFAITGRMEFTKLLPGLQVGVSTYLGNTSQGHIEEGGFMALLEADVQYRKEWFEMNATIVNTSISDTVELNAFCRAHSPCGGSIAENQFGFNIQAGVHLPQLMGWKTTQDIIPHFMFERVRTQDQNDSTYTIDRSKNRNQVYTAGIAYLPIPKVAIKADITHERLESNTSTEQFNMSVSYLY
jgi:hypothetical protein